MNEKTHYAKAKAEGRLCERCGWIVTVVDSRKGETVCGSCRDALRGVDVRGGHYPDRDEPRDKTGEE